MFWLDQYHVDGLRVDAVASMLYLDYSRKEGEWIPNKYGGRENLEAIDFLRQLNEAVYGEFPDIVTIAEESTAWPSVVGRPTSAASASAASGTWGGCTTRCSTSSATRSIARWHHDEITFRSVYMGSEHFVLPLSHDEVVHGKGSLLAQDARRRLAEVRQPAAAVRDAMAQPGKKLLFMGCELAPWTEWSHDSTLDWGLHDAPMHEGVRPPGRRAESAVSSSEPALHRGDTSTVSGGPGMQWIEAHDAAGGVFAWLRTDPTGQSRPVLVAVNATPTPQQNYRLGVPLPGEWTELFNSDAAVFGGSGLGNLGGVVAVPLDSHDQHQSVVITIPPLGVVALAPAD